MKQRLHKIQKGCLDILKIRHKTFDMVALYVLMWCRFLYCFILGNILIRRLRVYHFVIIDYISVYYNVEITRRSKPMWQITAMVGNRQ